MNRAILVVAALVVGGCTGYDVCGPSTCDGCCTADGVCVAGDSAAECGTNGLWCQACSGAQTCHAGACKVPEVVDSGTPEDAGMQPDAGVVFVTMRYDYQEQKAGGCPPEYVVATCSSVKVMSPDAFAVLRLEYPECNVSTTDSDGRMFDCTGHCAQRTDQCSNPSTGGISDYTYNVCPTPAHTSAAACQWDAP